MSHDEENQGSESEEFDANARSWIHPSELPNFQATGQVPAAIPKKTSHRSRSFVAAAAAVVLVTGGIVLTTRTATQSNDTTHWASTVADAPAYLQPTAASMVSVRISGPGVTSKAVSGLIVNAGTMVAITVLLPAGSVVTIITSDHQAVTAVAVREDPRTGLTLLAPRSALPAPVAEPAAMGTSSGATVLSVTDASGKSKFTWSAAKVSSSDMPVVVKNVALGTLRVKGTSATPGSSLVAKDGSLVGIATPSLGANAYLPASTISGLASSMAATPAATHGCLKVQAMTSQNDQGAEVTVVDPTGPAQGLLQVGDLITDVGGTRVRTVSDLVDALYALPASSNVTLVVQRDGMSHRVAVTLTNAP